MDFLDRLTATFYTCYGFHPLVFASQETLMFGNIGMPELIVIFTIALLIFDP
jgi:hypothetical protein